MFDKSLLSHLATELAKLLSPMLETLIDRLADRMTDRVVEKLGILNLDLPEFMTIEQVSKLLVVSRQTLRTWGYEGKFPRPLEMDGTVGPKRYARVDLVKWLAATNHPFNLQVAQSLSGRSDSRRAA